MTPIILFYIFATIMLLSAVMVVSCRNSVYAALFLVLTFCNAAGLFLLAGAEFLAVLLVAIYAGAVMVLFLFVVMTMQTEFIQLKEGMQRYMPVGLLVAFILAIEIILTAIHMHIDPNVIAKAKETAFSHVSNTQALGMVLYTHYVLLFQICGLILLVAMTGAIVLTLHKNPNNRRQNIARQHMREPDQTLEVRSVPLNAGIDEIGGVLRPKESYYGIAQKDSYGPMPGDETDITEKRQKREQLK